RVGGCVRDSPRRRESVRSDAGRTDRAMGCVRPRRPPRGAEPIRRARCGAATPTTRAVSPMSSAMGMHANAAMEGGGAYNRSSSIQAAGLAPAVPWLAEAARVVPLGPPDVPLIVADYGSSQGRNSLAPLRAAIGILRERTGADRPISVFHTDL